MILAWMSLKPSPKPNASRPPAECSALKIDTIMEDFVVDQLHREEQIQDICIWVIIIGIAFLVFAVIHLCSKR